MKDLTPKQIERLAIKNREAAEQRLKGEQDKRGTEHRKDRKTVYVERTSDPAFEDMSHQQLFNVMKKPPFST